MIRMNKCAVIGCGFVGATAAYTLTGSGLFSEIVLIDIDRRRAEGEAMDISQGLPFQSPLAVRAGDYDDLRDAGIVILAAGANQKVGETRLELLSRNMRIFSSILSELSRVNRDAIILVVTNPVDILTEYIIETTDYSPARVIGSGTVLDTARLKQKLGEHFSVDSRNVHAFIMGEHGDSEFPVWSQANISGFDLEDFCRLYGKKGDMETLDGLFREVRDSAYRIIEAKGATYYAIAQSVRRIVKSIVRNERSVLPISVSAKGHYGLHDVALGIPTVVGIGGAERILDVPLSPSEQDKLDASAATVRASLDSAMTKFV